MIDQVTRELVRTRAQFRCEYCLLHQRHIGKSKLHLDHVIPRKHFGGDDLGNLALACDQCNLRKGVNLSGIDQITGQVVKLYNLRRDTWIEHFEFRAASVVGFTACGRATVSVLDMNHPDRLEIRSLLEFLGNSD